MTWTVIGSLSGFRRNRYLLVTFALITALVFGVAGACEPEDGSWRDPKTWVGK